MLLFLRYNDFRLIVRAVGAVVQLIAFFFHIKVIHPHGQVITTGRNRVFPVILVKIEASCRILVPVDIFISKACFVPG